MMAGWRKYINHQDTKAPRDTNENFMGVLENQDAHNYSLVNLCALGVLVVNFFWQP